MKLCLSPFFTPLSGVRTEHVVEIGKMVKLQFFSGTVIFPVTDMKCNDPCPLNQDCLYDFLVISLLNLLLFLIGSTHPFIDSLTKTILNMFNASKNSSEAFIMRTISQNNSSNLGIFNL
ncbi:hypothetical protein Peur_059501 [Populus x canadensis]